VRPNYQEFLLPEDSQQQPIALLVHPVALGMEGLHRKEHAPSLALLSLRHALLAHGMECITLDALTLQKSGTTSWQTAIRDLLEAHPTIGIVGLTVYAHYRHVVDGLIWFLSERFPQKHLVLGGPQMSALSEMYAHHYRKQVSAIVCGPGESVVPPLFEELLKRQPQKAPIRILPERTDPWVAKGSAPQGYSDNFKLSATEGAPIHRASLITYRGCPYRTCRFCYMSGTQGMVRLRPVRQVRDELSFALEAGIRHLEIHDSDFLWNYNHIASILDGFDLSQVDSAYCHVDLASVTARKLELLRNTSCTWKIFSGLESASPRLRRIIKGRGNQDSVQRFFLGMVQARRMGVKVGVFVMFGHPEETTDDVAATFAFLRDHPPDDVFGTIVKYLPGTALYEEAKRMDIIYDFYWLDAEKPPVFYVPQQEDMARALAAMELLFEWYPTAVEHNKCERVQHTTLVEQHADAVQYWIDVLRSRIV
jgi:radical SAM superfamily enzyme YgiQ (UPF0313 family)